MRTSRRAVLLGALILPVAACGRRSDVPAVQEEAADLDAELGAAGLARAHHVVMLVTPAALQRLQVRGLAGTVYAFEAEESS